MHMARLFHWNATEAAERADQLRSSGFEVVYKALHGPADMRELADDLPDAFVIDLGRLPSHGRDIALYLRERKSTRHVPLVFAGGAQDKVERIKALLPDAAYTSWSGIDAALERAIADAPAAPVVPRSGFEAYSGTPLPKKLRVKEDSSVLLIDAPQDFKETLGDLPKGARLHTQPRTPRQLTIWFNRSRIDLEGRIEEVARSLADGEGLWIAWPKKASGVASDLSQNYIRELGLAAGLVDYKVCAIDRTWSGLLFTRRRSG